MFCPVLYRLLLDLNEFHQVFSEFKWILLSFTGFYRDLLGFTVFFWVLRGFTRFYRVLPGFTGFYRVLLGFTECTLGSSWSHGNWGVSGSFGVDETMSDRIG